MYFMPILIVYPLNLLTGTTYAFSLVWFLFITVVILLFNICEIHKKCIQHKVLRVVLEKAYLIMTLFMLLNVWTSTNARMPYEITNRSWFVFIIFVRFIFLQRHYLSLAWMGRIEMLKNRFASNYLTFQKKFQTIISKLSNNKFWTLEIDPSVSIKWVKY